MATGNIGRPGVGVNPLRGQNNVQGSCDMGSFPHELPGYRHISDDHTREIFDRLWGTKLDSEPGLRIPNMLDAAVDGSFKGLYVQGEDILQSDPDTHHVAAGLEAMECVVVHDLFLNETANYAHVFLPGSTFLEKDGTFTNAERRINMVRKVMEPKTGYADWEVTQLIARAIGLDWNYTHPSQVMDEIAATTPSFAGVSFDLIDREGSVQWPCNEKAPRGTPVMHVDGFVRGKGKFVRTEYIATDEKAGPRFPLLLTTGRILSQYNVGAQTRRTANVEWHEEDLLEIHPLRRGKPRHPRPRLGIAQEPLGRDDAARQDHRPRGAGRGLHDLPPPGHAGQRGDDRLFRLGDELPRVQGDGGAGPTLQRPGRMAGRVRGAGETVAPDRGHGAGGIDRAGLMESRPARRHVSRIAHGGHGVSSGTRCVPEETPVAMSFNGTSYAVMMATPADLEDFALGFALSEGIISAPEDIKGLDIIEVDGGIDCQMELADEASEALKRRRRRIAGPVGCGLCGIESIAEAVRPVPEWHGPEMRFTDIDVAQSVRLLAAEQPLHRETAAVHAAGFYTRDGGIVAAREDVGRHNALDKLVGALALKPVDASKGAIVITSRVSIEMVQKAAIAGAPVLIAVSAPTALAVRAADAAGLTLVARVRDENSRFSPMRTASQQEQEPMSPDKLVMMANQIAGFFETQPHEDAAAGTAEHINQFWEPRMRRQLLALMDGEGAERAARDGDQGPPADPQAGRSRLTAPCSRGTRRNTLLSPPPASDWPKSATG